MKTELFLAYIPPFTPVTVTPKLSNNRYQATCRKEKLSMVSQEIQKYRIRKPQCPATRIYQLKGIKFPKFNIGTGLCNQTKENIAMQVLAIQFLPILF